MCFGFILSKYKCSYFSLLLCVFIKFSMGLQDYFFLFHPISLGHVAAIASPRPIKRDKYPRSLSTCMKRVYLSTSKYIWGKCLKSLFRQQKNAVHQIFVKGSLKKQARFIVFFKLLRGKVPVVKFLNECLDN